MKNKGTEGEAGEAKPQEAAPQEGEENKS